MGIKLSQTVLETFVGNVLPLRLLGVEEYGMEDISWSVTGDCLQLTTFEKAEKGAFTDGVLLTILEEGHGQVAAQYNGCVYTCAVTCRSMKHTEAQKGLSYYIGNLHDHTAKTHDPALFPLREQGMPADYLKQLLEEGVYDFTAITDHADLLNDREFSGVSGMPIRWRKRTWWYSPAVRRRCLPCGMTAMGSSIKWAARSWWSTATATQAPADGPNFLTAMPQAPLPSVCWHTPRSSVFPERAFGISGWTKTVDRNLRG